MSIKKRVIDNIISEKRAHISSRETELENKRAAAFSYADVSESQSDYSEAVFADLKKGGDGNSKTVSEAYNRYLNVLKAHGFGENAFNYVPECKICGDTGINDGRLCVCTRKLFLNELQKECGILEKARFTFENSDLNAVKDEKQRTELQYAYETIKRFVDKFPDNKKSLITLSGGTGTGKTCLASAAARRALQRGCSALFVSAYEFNTKMLACHTSPISERAALLDDILTVDFLFVDDLGTEPRYRNVTVEYLLLVLTERQNRKLPTVITTNLSTENIKDAYTERICSRVDDKRNALLIKLEGYDLRR